MGEIKVDAGQWDAVVTKVRQRLAVVDSGERSVVSRTTIARLRELTVMQEQIVKTVDKYVSAAKADTEKMRRVADKLSEQDRAMASQFEEAGRNMAKFG